MSELLKKEKILILQRGGVEPTLLPAQAGIESLYEICSFTDTFPRENHYNSGLEDVANHAEHVFVAKESMLENSDEWRRIRGVLSSRVRTINVFTGRCQVDYMVRVPGFEKTDRDEILNRLQSYVMHQATAEAMK